MNDDYVHSDGKIIYIVENIPGPSSDSAEYLALYENFNSQLSIHCNCDSVCKNNCPCVVRSGGPNYVVAGDTENQDSSYKLNSTGKDLTIFPIIECNSLCKCSSECGNRIVQKGPRKGLLVKSCKNISKGIGLFTETNIPKGTFVCEYAGEVITKTEALLRHKKNIEKSNMNYIYCLNEYCDEKIIQTFVDPSVFGNIGRYINHSCDPNCRIMPVRVDTPVPKLAVFSKRDLPSGTELTFDYKSQNNIEDLLELPAPEYYDKTKCLCKSVKCRGWMPFEIYE